MALLEGHATIAYGDELYIFGGKDNKTGQLLNTVWRISISAAAQAAINYTDKVLGAAATAAGGVDANANRAGYAAELAMQGSGAVATVVQTTGTPPTPRCFCSAALRPPFALFWGGSTLHPATVVSPRGERVSEATARETIIFALNLDTREWGVHVLGGKDTKCPRPRCHATMVPTAHSILLYGGYPTLHDEDTGAAHVEPNHWSVFEVGADAQVRSNARSGSEVPMLWGHTALFAHGCLVVFGGVDFATMTETNALCLFSLEEKRWRWAEFALAPEARALHTAVLHGSNVFVYGGFTGRPDRTETPTFSDVWRFSLNTGIWDEVATTGAHPPARSGHTATVTQNKMLVIGGLEGNNETLAPYSTLAVLDLQTFEWTQCPIVFPPGNSTNAIAAGQHHHHGGDESSGQMWGGLSAGAAAHNNSSMGGGGAASFRNAMSSSPASAGVAVPPSATSPSSPPVPRNNRLSASQLAARTQSPPGPPAATATAVTPPSATANAQLLRQSGLAGRSSRGGAGAFGSPTNAHEQALMEAAAPVAFGSMTNNMPVPDFTKKARNVVAGGGIPSAVAPGSSRSSTPGGGAGAGAAVSGGFMASPSGGNFRSAPSSNNQFSASLAMNQRMQQQQQQQLPPSSNSAANSRTPSAAFGSPYAMQPQYQQYQQQQPSPNYANSSSVLGALGGGGLDDLSPLKPQPPLQHLQQSSPSASPDHSPPQFQQQQQQQQITPYRQADPRSPSNLLLANIRSSERQANDERETERLYQQQLASIRAEHVQMLQQYQAQLARQGVQQHTDPAFQQRDTAASGAMSAAPSVSAADIAQQHRMLSQFGAAERQASPSPSVSFITGAVGDNNNNNNNGVSGDMSWARSTTPTQASPAALAAAQHRRINRTPPRPDGGDSPGSNSGNNSPSPPNQNQRGHAGFAPATQGVAAQAAQIAALQQLRDAQMGPPPEDLPVFGVRPAGGLGRSSSVGLGMPPAMIDVMGASSSPNRFGGNAGGGNNNNNSRQSPGRWSPGRSSSLSSLRSAHARR